jgi:hypothetical protein
MGYLAELDTPSPSPVFRAPRPVPVAARRPAPERNQNRETHGAKRTPRIELDTPIVPRAVAEAVWEEACVWLEEELPQRWVVELAERANVIYQHNANFRRLLHRSGNAGRDWLWAFSRHWLSALIWKHRRHLHARLPDSYSIGHALPQEKTARSMTSTACSGDEIQIVKDASVGANVRLGTFLPGTRVFCRSARLGCL